MEKSLKIIMHLYILVVLVTTSCINKNVDLSKPEDPKDRTKGYVKAEVDGSEVMADYTYPNNSFYSSYKVQENEVGFIRDVPLKNQYWSIGFYNIDLDNLEFPYKIPSNFSAFNPNVSILYDDGTSESDDSFSSIYTDADLYSVTLTKWSNDVLEGTFQGKLNKENSSSTVTFVNGEFKVKLDRY